MSGVLTSDGESLIQSTLGKQAAGLGGGVGGGRPRRPGRPRGLGGRRKKPRRRPTTPRPEYDYYYDDDDISDSKHDYVHAPIAIRPRAHTLGHSPAPSLIRPFGRALTHRPFDGTIHPRAMYK